MANEQQAKETIDKETLLKYIRAEISQLRRECDEVNAKLDILEKLEIRIDLWKS